MAQPLARLFGKLNPASERNLADTLRAESAGGVLLLLGAAAALLWANGPWAGGYERIHDAVIGPHALHLDLSVSAWAADGLLAIFFFVIGLELKREIVAGQLRNPATAVVPIVAAVGGMVVPAALYLAFNLTADAGDTQGWAVPVATDIAFAVAILAIVGKRLPSALRAFLLTLAVVDDLLAIVVIAVFYSDHLSLVWLGAAALLLVGFWWLVRKGITSPWLLIPVAVVVWALVHASGVHATIAGVALGLVVPAVEKAGGHSLAERWEHLWRPISAGVAVPIFALFAAGVVINADAITAAAADPVAQGVAAGLVLGKPIGIVVATFVVARFTKASLDDGLSWWDVVGMACLAGIGFTVSLLIGELAFDPSRVDVVKMAVLGGSLCAALLGGGILAYRSRVYARASASADS